MKVQEQGRVLSEATLESLACLSSDAARSRFFERRRSLVRPRVAQELNEAAQLTMRVNTRRALAFASAGVLIARRLRAKTIFAQSLRIKANVLASLGEHHSAIKLLRIALRLFRETRDREGIARTLTAAIQPLILLGEYGLAQEYAGEAKGLFEALGDTRRLAMVENNIGNIFHRQDRFEEALERYEHGYELLLPFGDNENLLISFNNLAMCLISLNDFRRALAIYQRAQEVSQREKLPVLGAISDYNIAYLYYLRGEYRKAVAGLQVARERAKTIDDPRLLALCHLDLSEVYVELNLSEEAIEMAEEGHKLFSKLGMRYEAAKALVNQAIALSELGEFSHSVEVFAQARQKFAEEGNAVWPYLIDLYEAILYGREGKYTEARRLCVLAAEFFDSSALTRKSILCHILLADFSLRTQDLAVARKECHTALSMTASLDAPLLVYKALFLLGEIFEADGEMQSAYETYLKASSELEKLRAGLDRDDLRIAFMEDKSAVYEFLAGLCLTGGCGREPAKEAIHYVELAKSRSLADSLLRRAPALPKSSVDSGLVGRISDLREELSWYQHRLEMEQLRPHDGSRQRLESLERETQNREKALRKALCDLPSAESENDPFLPASSIPVEEMRRRLPADVSLVEYFSIRGRVFAAVIERECFKIQQMTTTSVINAPLRFLRFQLEKMRCNQSSIHSHEKLDLEVTQCHLRELHSALMAPLGEMLNGRHIVIVPHGILHHIPFHALFDGSNYVIDSCSISYAPSMSVYALCERRQVTPRAGALLFGIPDSRAPRIAEEVEAVHRVLPESELVTGPAATLELLRERGPQCRFVHIASHARFRRDNPMFSGFWLGDCFLHVHELHQLHLPIELLVLSGCSTGLSLVAGGDEQMGLVRGVLGAGAHSALLTLWDVHDRTTSRFMEAFYRQLVVTDDRSASLRHAMRELRESHPHPYYWAPFYLVGGTS